VGVGRTQPFRNVSRKSSYSKEPQEFPGAGNAHVHEPRLRQVRDLKATDADLIERCRRKEPGAFEQLYRVHASRVYNLACRLSGSTADGEDLSQEVFVLIFRKLESFKGEAALGTWIYRLATNHCLDFLRRRYAVGRSEPFDEAAAPMPSTTPLRAERMDLERAIARLPPGYRAAFVLHDVEGFGHHEIASILGIAEGTSKSQVHKARLKLREYLSGATAASHGPRRAQG
jgi:RNA polymerase sigma-70 factor (ECF subfamily)